MKDSRNQGENIVREMRQCFELSHFLIQATFVVVSEGSPLIVRYGTD